MNPAFLSKLITSAESKIVLLVLDGLGGLPQNPGGKTELETACKPNLNDLASQSILGLSVPAGPGVAVGSGPGHLALFGYDPIEYEIGRGALEALGVDFELGPDDVAARGNFCSVDGRGLISDRRAGRIASSRANELLELLGNVRVDKAQIFLRLIKEHRFAFIMRGEGLGGALSDTDPLKEGAAPCPVRALNCESEKAARIANQFIEGARCVLADRQPANMITLRGFARFPTLPSFQERFGLHAAAIAINGMYRGVACLAGMQVLNVPGTGIGDEFAVLERCWPEFDFFYLHVKKTDTCGEAGDFDGKVHAIEEVDALVPRLLALKPDALIIAGDHSSPAVLRAHSWHPVPVLLYAPNVRPDGIPEFGERACGRGSLGMLPATHLLPIALANAGRIAKYGA